MKQEIRATVTVTFEADAELCTAMLRTAIEADLQRLLGPTTAPNVEAVAVALEDFVEEAAIYSTKGTRQCRVRP